MPRRTNKDRRCIAMLHAFLHFHARKLPQPGRELSSWVYLMEWARLGGKPDEVIGSASHGG